MESRVTYCSARNTKNFTQRMRSIAIVWHHRRPGRTSHLFDWHCNTSAEQNKYPSQQVLQVLVVLIWCRTKPFVADTFHDFGQKKDPRKNGGRTERIVIPYQLTIFIYQGVPLINLHIFSIGRMVGTHHFS